MASATNPTDWKQYLGRRVLVRVTTPGDSGEVAHEVIVAEVAATSGFVKLHPRGWFAPASWELVEVLSATSVIDDLQAAVQANADLAATHEAAAKQATAALVALQGDHEKAKAANRAHWEKVKARTQEALDATAALEAERRAHAETKGLHAETTLQLTDERRAHAEAKAKLAELTAPAAPLPSP